MVQKRLAQIERAIICLSCFIIQLYRWLLSPLAGQHCRFWPSCSCYAQQALQQHGFWRGSWLSARRICRCHPGHPGGVDLVPSRPNSNSKDHYE